MPRACRVPSGRVPIGGGLALVAAAMAKLFLFDLGTLDGIFRVVVFIVVGLVLLGMGAGYARLLEKQDRAGCDHAHGVNWIDSRSSRRCPTASGYEQDFRHHRNSAPTCSGCWSI